MIMTTPPPQVTPASESRAFNTARAYHLDETTGNRKVAWHASKQADPQLRADIRHYLRTDTGWVRVVADYNPDA